MHLCYVNLICSLPLWNETVHVRERENVSNTLSYNEGRSFSLLYISPLCRTDTKGILQVREADPHGGPYLSILNAKNCFFEMDPWTNYFGRVFRAGP